jgi:hypothetical protein
MEKLYSRVFCISERMFVAESITIAKNQELKNSELNQQNRFSYCCHSKDAKAVVTEEKKKNE